MELIKCIDPNEGEALRRGVHLQTWASGAPYPSVPLPMGAGGEGEGGGREDIGL